MRSALGGILTGSLLLIVGQVVLSASGTTSSGANTLLSLFQVPAKLAANWMSPAVPLIPNLAAPVSAKPAKPTPAAPSTPPGSQTGGGVGVPTFPLPLPVVP